MAYPRVLFCGVCSEGYCVLRCRGVCGEMLPGWGEFGYTERRWNW